LAYAEALNNRDARGIADYLWFPGPDYPDQDPVAPDLVPPACIEGELALFDGLTIDTTRVRAERRAFGATAGGGDGAVLVGEFDVLWLPVADGQEDGRQFAKVGGRVVISPQENAACEQAARAVYGESS
jgi:hypothetical protein